MSSAAARGGGSGQNLSGALILGARSPLLEGAGCHRRAARVWRRRAAAPGLRAIVIGKRGEDADFASGHLGSNLARIVRAVSVTVFVAARGFRPIGRVLVAFDGSASARKAIARMAYSPAFCGLQITVLHVDTGAGPLGP